MSGPRSGENCPGRDAKNRSFATGPMFSQRRVRDKFFFGARESFSPRPAGVPACCPWNDQARNCSLGVEVGNRSRVGAPGLLPFIERLRGKNLYEL